MPLPRRQGRCSEYPGSAGFSILEAAIGVTVLFLLVAGVVLFSKNSIRANAIGQDTVKGSSVLKDFLEELRALDLDSIPRNREMSDSSGPYKITWTAFDETSPGEYMQPPGLVLVCVRMTYQLKGGARLAETSTLLGRE